jgi:minimal PKS acyl carrier protein
MNGRIEMDKLTLARLMEIIGECSGETTELTAEIEDTSFETLGYDSLALLETASRLERDYGVRLDDDEVMEAKTPRLLLLLVNDTLS